jgi:hypothetical protein
MSDDVKFLLNGKTVTLKDARKASVLVASTEDNVVQLFPTQSAFLLWAEKSEHADKFAQIEEFVARAKKYQKADNTTAIKRQQTAVKRITKDLKDLAKLTGLEANSEELFVKATVDYHPLEGPIFDPSILYQHINRGGRFLPLAAGIGFPDFTWLGFNDITSSVMGTGYCSLWADVWYFGRRLTLVGPYPPLPPVTLNLTSFGFNDVASSALVY